MRVLLELQASYNKKLSGLYRDQYELGYWAGYAKAKQIACDGLELSTEESPKLTCSMESVKPSSLREEARVLLVPTGDGASEGVATASAEPIVIILQEFPTVVTELLDLLLLRMYLNRPRWLVLGIPFV